ncbi:hypothetical protein ACA910_020105 [Epithemia clementina (nom. ined.)]
MNIKSSVLCGNASASNNQIETFPSTTTTSSTSSISTSDGEDIGMVDNLPMEQKKNKHLQEDESTREDPTIKKRTFDSLDAGIEGLLGKNGVTQQMHPNFHVCFDDVNNQSLFACEYRNMGAAYLVSRSQFKIESQTNNLDESDVKMHTRIALLVDTLSRGQQDLLAKCLGDVQDHVIRKEIKHSRQSYRDILTCPMEMRVPQSSNDMCKTITKGENAFLENLPGPPMVTENNHAYVRLGDCIGDLLAHGTQVSFLLNRKDNKDLYPNSCRVSLEQSAKADEICEDVLSQDFDVNYPVLHLYCICWSDDCDPNGTNKNNCGSIWVRTDTISSPKSVCWPNTYVLNVGHKGDDHSVVESSFNDEIKELSSPNSKRWFYYHRERKMVRVHVRNMLSWCTNQNKRDNWG